MLFRDAQRLGVDDPLTFVRYARHSLTLPGTLSSDLEEIPKDAEQAIRDAATRAREVLERAVNSETHYAVAYQLLAAAHLVPGGDPTKGLEAALAAQRIEPYDVLPRILEVRLRLELAKDPELGRGQIEQAELRISGLDAYGAGPEVVLDLEQRVDVARWLRAADLALVRGDDEEGLDALDHAVSAAGDPDQRQRLEARLRALRAASGS